MRREGCEGQSVAKRDKKDAKGSLGAAATALEDAISRYEDLVASAGRIPLHSQKNLEKAAEALQSAATLQEAVGERLRGLADAIATTSERQIVAAEALQRHAQAVQERTSATSALLARFEDLGREAREINGLVVAAMAASADASSPDRVRETVAGLETVENRMSAGVERAAELGHAAENAGLVDLARQAEALRQQILSSRNKVHLVRASFG